MDKYKLFDAEYRFATIIWEVEPINSTELVKICHKRLGWKKSTTYTVLKKLCDRGVLQNVNTIVTSLVTNEQVQKYEGEALLNRTFDGSLPTLLATFLQDRKLSAGEAGELRRMIEDAEE
ncbi:MAG: BlaI/MecI/CopY family transcriptional regulator [Peptococcaceae bacterium]|nr:BlaI/MecI/CopY family transcriptional regulator [Peptococcaceae bacterium]